MQLDVFSTDDSKSGFRLQYMEVFNWGTFDGHIHSIRPMGETCLLTGANGSGKTTFVDALLTLIVPEKRYRFYNQSSGSEKKGDRTEESYVLGGFNTMHSEATGANRVVYLRDNKEEAYSILLAGFANETDQEVTLFQVRWFVNGEMKRVFGIALKGLHIEADFIPFDHRGDWKRRLEMVYNKGSRRQVDFFDAASRYAQRLVEVLGMQSIQALILFNQTVGIKVLDNLDDFIRTHMLEPRNIDGLFQELKTHLATLLDAQRNIEKVEEQIRLLEPLHEHLRQYGSAKTALAEIRLQLETARVWKSYVHDHLLQESLTEGRREIASLIGRIEDSRSATEASIEAERHLRNQIEQNEAGQRIGQLQQDLEEYQRRKAAAEKEREQFRTWCATIGLTEQDPVNEAAYGRIKRECEKKFRGLETRQRNIEEDEFAARKILDKSGPEKDKVETELNLLQQYRSNIRTDLVELRRNLCEHLGLDTSELPFAGELMQVRTDQQAWQPALEKLLHNFALRLLVPDRHYKRVNRHVNNTDIRARLVYYRVGETIMSNPEAGTAFHKLEFHPDHTLTEWVRQQVIRSFDHICLDDEKTLDRYDKAVTLRGLVKDRLRHEKDDRPGHNDPSRYVMGWNNEKKKALMIERRNRLAAAIEAADESMRSCEKQKKRLYLEMFAAGRLMEHEGYSLADVEGWQRKIHDATRQLEKLRVSNNTLRQLVQQLEEVQQERKDAETVRDGLSSQRTLLQARIDAMELRREELQELLQYVTEEDKDGLIQFQTRHAAELAAVSLEHVDAIYTRFVEQRKKLENTEQDQLRQSEKLINRAIHQIRNPSADILQRFSDWAADVQFLPEDAEHAGEYDDWLTKLKTENLPRYRRDFENYINDTITYKIGGFNEELERWERDIVASIQKLNHSLAGINFNRSPDTYIQLGRRAVNDTTIKSFRSALLDALPQAANWQESGFEEKSLHFRLKVQTLIAKLDESEHYRLRVLDVRNWFEFWADERYRNTEELRKTYRQMGQLSGGEKPQLTYTILCSAIAYQFGITREGKNSRSLRFIAVDESFSNQDEDKATYLMELCRQLHLQLLVVTPSDKIQVVQDYIAHVHLVQRVEDRHSVIYNMTIKELKEKMAES